MIRRLLQNLKAKVGKDAWLLNFESSLVLVLILLLPTQIGIHFWPDFASVYGIRIDYLSPTVYLTDILAFGLIFLKFPINLSKRFWFWFFQLVIYLGASSFLFAENSGAAIYKLIKIVELLFLGIVLYRSSAFNKKQINTGLSIIVIFTSLLAVLQILKGSALGLWILGERMINITSPGVTTLEIFGQEFLRPYATFSHPNSLAGFVLVSLILLFPWKTKPEKLALAFGVLILLLSWSQTIWMASIILILFSLLRNSRKYLFLISVLFSLSPIFLSGLFGSQDVQLRKILLEASYKMFLENPLIGIGLNNFIPQLPQYLFSAQVWVLQPVHNIFVLAIVEIGLLGIAVLLWGLRFINIKLLFANFAFWAILLTGFLDHYWLTLQQNQLLFVVALVLMLKDGTSKPL